MDRPAPFYANDGEVFWNAAGRPFCLTIHEVETILDIFERNRAVELFNTLHEAMVAAGGVERASGLLSRAA